jgi:hypothetical protein
MGIGLGFPAAETSMDLPSFSLAEGAIGVDLPIVRAKMEKPKTAATFWARFALPGLKFFIQ